MTQAKIYTEEEILELWNSAESIPSIAIITRVPQKQLRALAAAKKWPPKFKIPRRHLQDKNPTVAEIMRRAAQVRANWSEAELENRSSCAKRIDYRAGTYSYNANKGVFDGLG
jgi:hypothetical protein